MLHRRQVRKVLAQMHLVGIAEDGAYVVALEAVGSPVYGWRRRPAIRSGEAAELHNSSVAVARPDFAEARLCAIDPTAVSLAPGGQAASQPGSSNTTRTSRGRRRRSGSRTADQAHPHYSNTTRTERRGPSQPGRKARPTRLQKRQIRSQMAGVRSLTLSASSSISNSS